MFWPLETPPLHAKREPTPTERLQLAAMDQANGMDAFFLQASEKSFLDALSRDEKHRLFLLTAEERTILEGAVKDQMNPKIGAIYPILLQSLLKHMKRKPLTLKLGVIYPRLLQSLLIRAHLVLKVG